MGKQMTREEASEILWDCGFKRMHQPDFHELPSWQVDALLKHAGKRNYRAPKEANGSRARYFFAYLQRRLWS